MWCVCVCVAVVVVDDDDDDIVAAAVIYLNIIMLCVTRIVKQIILKFNSLCLNIYSWSLCVFHLKKILIQRLLIIIFFNIHQFQFSFQWLEVILCVFQLFIWQEHKKLSKKHDKIPSAFCQALTVPMWERENTSAHVKYLN